MDQKRSTIKKESDDVLELVYKQLFKDQTPARKPATVDSSNGGSQSASRLASLNPPRPTATLARSTAAPPPPSATTSARSALDEIEAEILPDLWTHRDKIISISKLVILDYLAKTSHKNAPEIRGKLTLEDAQKIQKLLSDTKDHIEAFVAALEGELNYIQRRTIVVNEKENTIQID